MDKEIRDFYKIAQKIERSTGAKKKSPLLPRLNRTLVRIFILVNLGLIILPPFQLPLQGTVTSGFFFRFNPTAHGIELHKGVDIAAPAGTKVKPTCIGIVRAVGTSPSLGNYVEIGHPLGFSSVYGHLSAVTIKKGSWVLPQLSTIGRAGSTGRSTGPHLHFGIQWGRFWVPPSLPLIYDRIQKLLTAGIVGLFR